jgi:hypothetical protein
MASHPLHSANTKEDEYCDRIISRFFLGGGASRLGAERDEVRIFFLLCLIG